jgi:hypothetical protein
MARALEQILQELNSVYNPQRDVYNKQITALPGQQEGELKGLEAAKTDSFGQIVQGANRRGVAFGGIPLGEQAQYLGSTYLPAVANLKNRFQQQRFNLQDALAQIGISQRKDAYSIYNDELARDEAAAARRAASAGGSGVFGGFGGAPTGGGGGGVQGAQTVNADQLYSYLAQKYKQNPSANRATQDRWVQAWAMANGVDSENNDSLWKAYDSRYPWAKYNDAAVASRYSSGGGLQTISSSNGGLRQLSSGTSAGGW